jgi:hypothetical protein
MNDVKKPVDPNHAKLKAARSEIEAVLKRHDIAGFVALHSPGWGETFWNIWPSYSILIGDFPAIRIKSKLADYGGDAARQITDQAQTAEMVHSIADATCNCGLQFAALDEVLTDKLGVEHVDKGFIPDPSKFNPGVH